MSFDKQETNSFAIIRADDDSKAKTSVLDLSRYGKLTISDSPRLISPEFADEILVDIMRTDLSHRCEFAIIVPLNNPASQSIGRLRKIHPPSHIIIVSPKHEIFNTLKKEYDTFPIFKIDSDNYFCGFSEPISQKCY